MTTLRWRVLLYPEHVTIGDRSAESVARDEADIWPDRPTALTYANNLVAGVVANDIRVHTVAPGAWRFEEPTRKLMFCIRLEPFRPDEGARA
jgi:hypothetical protein